MTRRTLWALAALLAVAASLLLWRAPHRLHEYQSDQFLMDTMVSIKAYGPDRDLLRSAVGDAYAEMRRIADLADGFPEPGSPSFEASDVCRINACAGKSPVKVAADTMAMLELAKRYHRESGGAFDVTVGPLMELWGFGGKNPRLPRPERIEAALQLVDGRDLVLDARSGTAFLRREGMKIDLGAVAKGYATEKALAALAKRGVEKALIDAGGNIRVLGKNAHGAPWRIGIKDPRRSGGIVAALGVEDLSAVTSGDYYRGFEAGGKRYHHILDPRTGYPAGHAMSATVLTKDAGLADILSTICFVLPPERALEFASRFKGVELFLVGADGRLRYSPSLAGRMELTPGTGYRP